MPAAQEALCIFKVEAEGVFGLREMLEKDLIAGAGASIAEALRVHVREAMTAGDFGSEELLKEMLMEHEQNVHHLEHFLGPSRLALDILR